MSVRLLFLRSKGYFFDSCGEIYWTEHLDPFIANLLTGSTNEPQVGRLLHIAIAHSSAFLLYQDKQGKLHIRHNLPSTYPKLAHELTKIVLRQGEQYHVALGPDGQFFALLNGHCLWYGTPDGFRQDIQNMGAGKGRWKEGYEPNGAIFGIKRSYLITCKGGSHLVFNSNLRQHYPGLVKRLEKRFRSRGSSTHVYDYITINPYAADEWVVLWADDTVSWSLPPSILALAAPLGKWLSTKTGNTSAQFPVASPTQKAISPTFPNPTPARPMAVYPNIHPKPQPSAPQTTYSSPNRPSYNSLHTTSGCSNVSSYTSGFNQPSATAAPSMPTMWSQPNDTTTKQIQEFFKVYGQCMSTINKVNNAGSSGNSTGGLLSGALGGNNPTGGLLSGALGGNDPTGGLLSSGLGGGMPVDPFSMAAGVLTPNSCNIM